MTVSTEKATFSDPPNIETQIFGILWYKTKARFWFQNRTLDLYCKRNVPCHALL